MPGKVYMPTTDTYDARLESIFSATAALEPWCLALPETTEDVSKFMEVIATGECSFGIRSGGHAVYANGNSVEDGITLDMGYINATTYDAETHTASVGAGARWAAVYDTLAKDGVAVVGGRVSGVGVGGLVTGGGNSFHSSRYGFACDTVQAYEVVLANGTIVSATEDSHPDLFRGLCGASGNLGIVTKFVMKAVHLAGGKAKPHIWGGVGTFSYENVDLLDELVDFTERSGEDDGASAFCGWFCSQAEGDKACASACVLQHVDDDEAAPLFDGIRNTPENQGLGDTYRSAPISDFTEEVGLFVQHHKQYVLLFLPHSRPQSCSFTT